MEQATNLIGRGHGGGGRGGRGGFGGRGGRGGRRFFGGGWGGGYDSAYGYGYPYPLMYGDPGYGYAEEAEEVEEVSGAGEPPDYLRDPRGSLLPRAGDDLRSASHILRLPSRGLSCDLNLGPDLVLRARICVDGRCYQGQLDLSRLIQEIHARLHGWDVTEEVVGRRDHSGRGQRRHHHRRRHHRHRRDEDRDQEEQGGDQGREPLEDRRFDPGPGLAPSYPPYPYPYPPVVPQPVIAPVVPAAVAQPLPPEATTAADGLATPGKPRGHRGAQAEEDAAVKASGELLVDQLYDQHCGAVCGSWLSSIGDAITRTIQRFKGPVTVAAAAVATYYGGPQSGELAAKLVPSVIDASTADGAKKEKAQATMSAARQAAQGSPQIAQALSTAQRATATVAAAYHVAETAAGVLRGDPDAQQRVEQLRQDASLNPQSREALADILSAIRALSASDQPQEQPATATISGAHVASARQSDLRGKAQQVAVRAQRDTGVPVVGVTLEVDGTPSVATFYDAREAQDWVDEAGPDCLYAAYYDASDTTWPEPVDEVVDPAPGVPRTISQGWFAPFLLGLAGGAAIDRWILPRAKSRAKILDRHVQAAADEVVAHKAREAVTERDRAQRDVVPPGAGPPLSPPVAPPGGPGGATTSGAIWPWALGLGAAAGLAWWLWPRHRSGASVPSPYPAAPPLGVSEPPPATSSGAGQTIHQLRNFAVDVAARAFQTRPDAQAVVVALSPSHGTFAIPYAAADEAVHYVHHVDPRSMSYVAAVVVDVTDPAGRLFVLADRETRSAGWRHAAEPGVVSGGMTSSELAHARADAVAAAQEAYARCAQAGNPCQFFGVVRTRGATEPRPGGGAVVLEDTTALETFGDESSMRAWYDHVTADSRSYEYVALFDARHRVWPGPVLSEESTAS